MVFISHSTADKERFVHHLVTRLCESGIDVWYDDWELLPGDSLIEKIFEYGLKEASEFIVVLSSNSIESKWVKEELHNATVSKIAGKCKIIPIILDDVEVPNSLADIIHIKIQDETNCDSEIKQIIDSILTQPTNKPALGKLPAYATEYVQPQGSTIPQASVSVLRHIGNIYAVDPLRMSLLQSNEYDLIREGTGLSDSQFQVEMSRLRSYGFIEPLEHSSSVDRHCRITSYGLIVVMEMCDQGFPNAMKEIAAYLWNECGLHGVASVSQIVEATEHSEATVLACLEWWDTLNYINLSRTMGGLSSWSALVIDPLLMEEAT